MVKLAVVGDPVAHSLSPHMHNAALAQLAVQERRFENWHYGALHLKVPELIAQLGALGAQGYHGLNLTIPHKVEIVSHLVAISDEARAMGAVNTLIWSDGGYRGENTDGYGIERAIESCFGSGFAGRDVWLYGAGGAARGIAVRALRAGCARLTLVNRNQERLAGLLAGLTAQWGDSVRGFQSAAAPADYGARPLLINATALGLNAADPPPFAAAALPREAEVYDTTYGCRNALAHACERAGLRYADGLSMLVWQGVRSLEIWSGKRVAAQWMEAAALAELKKRQGT